jgi:hypothetical protein
MLPKLSPLQIQTLKPYLTSNLQDMLWAHEALLSSSQKQLSHIVNQTMRALLMGPCDFEAWLLHRALGFIPSTNTKLSTPEPQKRGGGVLSLLGSAKRKVTNVVSQSAPTFDRMSPLSVLQLVLLGRKNGDIAGIKKSYETRFPGPDHSILKKLHSFYPDIPVNKTTFPLGEDDKDTISLYCDHSKKSINDPRYRLFDTALQARRSTGVVYDVSQDVKALDMATTGKFSAAITIEILVTRSSEHLSAVVQAFAQQGQRKSLVTAISDKLDGTGSISKELKECLCWILDGLTVKDAAARDAKALEATMKGIGEFILVFVLLSFSNSLANLHVHRRHA